MDDLQDTYFRSYLIESIVSLLTSAREVCNELPGLLNITAEV